jgi:hypothetical protein
MSNRTETFVTCFCETDSTITHNNLRRYDRWTAGDGSWQVRVAKEWHAFFVGFRFDRRNYGGLDLSLLIIAIMSFAIAYLIRNTGLALASCVFLLMVLPLLLELMPQLNQWPAVLPSVSAQRFIFPTFFTNISGWHDPGRLGSMIIMFAWALPTFSIAWLYYKHADIQRPT